MSDAAGAQSGTAQSGTAQSGTAQSGTAQSGTAQSGTAQSGTAQSGTAQSGTAQSGTAQSGTAQSGTAQSGTAQSGTAQSGTAQSGTAQSGPARPGAPSPITLGLDLGTSAVKVVALGFDDELIGEGTGVFATAGALPLQAEQTPSDWLRAASSAMRVLRESVERKLGGDWPNRIGAIGLTGQLPTLVCLADEGPLAPAITWKDGRADAWACTRLDAARRAQMYTCTGMPIDGRYLAPMLQFHFAARIAEIRCILSAKDYLLSALTGRWLTEPSTAAGYGTYDLQARCFSRELCQFWDLPSRLLPRVLPANSLAGPLSEAGAALLGLRAGIPVSTGAADSVCAAYAMAGFDERTLSISFGSSAVLVGASAKPRLDRAARYLVTPHVAAGWYGLEMDLLATGTGYRWLGELFAWRDGQIDTYAAESIPGSHGLYFPPYLAGGEQGALWNSRLRGAILGLTLQHSRSDIARAYLEGVFYEIRRCVEVLAEAAPIDSVRVSGNIVQSTSSTQMLADILNCVVSTTPDKSPAAIGAALLARQIVPGQYADRRQSLSYSATNHSTTNPRGAHARAYTALYQAYVARAASCQ
jgi:xylulokinase